jgi:hypothetical protein
VCSATLKRRLADGAVLVEIKSSGSGVGLCENRFVSHFWRSAPGAPLRAFPSKLADPSLSAPAVGMGGG